MKKKKRKPKDKLPNPMPKTVKEIMNNKGLQKLYGDDLGLVAFLCQMK